MENPQGGCAYFNFFTTEPQFLFDFGELTGIGG